MGLFLIGVVALFLVSAVFAVGIGKAIALGNDHDAPAHVGVRDWQRVSKRRL